MKTNYLEKFINLNVELRNDFKTLLRNNNNCINVESYKFYSYYARIKTIKLKNDEILFIAKDNSVFDYSQADFFNLAELYNKLIEDYGN